MCQNCFVALSLCRHCDKTPTIQHDATCQNKLGFVASFHSDSQCCEPKKGTSDKICWQSALPASSCHSSDPALQHVAPPSVDPSLSQGESHSSSNSQSKSCCSKEGTALSATKEKVNKSLTVAALAGTDQCLQFVGCASTLSGWASQSWNPIAEAC